MRINTETENFIPEDSLRVGNVYPIRGGRSMRDGCMHVVFDIVEPRGHCQGRMALSLIVTKDGEVVGCTHHGAHYFDDKAPIAFCEGLEDLTITMRSI